MHTLRNRQPTSTNYEGKFHTWLTRCAVCEEYLPSGTDRGVIPGRMARYPPTVYGETSRGRQLPRYQCNLQLSKQSRDEPTVLCIRNKQLVRVHLRHKRLIRDRCTLSCISQPNITLSNQHTHPSKRDLQNPNPDRAADINLSLAIILPLITPSASMPATLTLVSSTNSASSCSKVVNPIARETSKLRPVKIHPCDLIYCTNQEAKLAKLRR